MVPCIELSQQDDAGACAALIAVVGAGSILIIESVAVLAPTDRARTVFIDYEVPGLDAEPQQDLLPPPRRALDGAASHPRCVCIALA